MRPLESFVSQPIRSLQTMLRVIAEQDPGNQSVVPDGIYGPQTIRAVTSFQRQHGLPATGVTDQATWEAICDVYQPALVAITESEPLNLVLNPNQIIRKGEHHPNVYVIQAILQVLSDTYSSISQPTHSGILDEITSDSIASFQVLSGLPMTGHMDKLTWKHIALHYPLAAVVYTNRQTPSSIKRSYM